MAMNNIFLGGGDPLLGQVQSYQRGSVEDELARIAAMQQQLDQKKMEIENAKLNMNQSVQSKTPIWDEIDKIVGEMSDSEIEFINSNADFANSNQTVMAILQREQLRMMRPLVENTKDGKEALENHLALVKRLKKEAANESDKAMNMFKEYTEKYSDMPYSEYLKMKRKKEK